MEDEYDDDYQPSTSRDDDNTIQVADQSTDEVITNGSLLVNHAISRNGAVIPNKHQFCYFCEKPQLNLSRQLKSQLKTESAVAQIIASESVNHKKYQAGISHKRCIVNVIFVVWYGFYFVSL